MYMVTWESVGRCDEIVRSKQGRRFECLVTQVKSNSLDLTSVKILATSWEKLQLYLEIIIIVEERVL